MELEVIVDELFRDLDNKIIGGHLIYIGIFKNNNKKYTIWTQIGSEENSGQPAADIIITKKEITLFTDEIQTNKTWRFPISYKELEEIIKEINKLLSKYYGQFKEQPRFIKET